MTSYRKRLSGTNLKRKQEMTLLAMIETLEDRTKPLDSNRR
jgi:hypothetical protein